MREYRAVGPLRCATLDNVTGGTGGRVSRSGARGTAEQGAGNRGAGREEGAARAKPREFGVAGDEI